jgi:hypothetical protein
MPKLGDIGPIIVGLFIVWIIASGNWQAYWDFVTVNNASAG